MDVLDRSRSTACRWPAVSLPKESHASGPFIRILFHGPSEKPLRRERAWVRRSSQARGLHHAMEPEAACEGIPAGAGSGAPIAAHRDSLRIEGFVWGFTAPISTLRPPLPIDCTPSMVCQAHLPFRCLAFHSGSRALRTPPVYRLVGLPQGNGARRGGLWSARLTGRRTDRGDETPARGRGGLFSFGA